MTKKRLTKNQVVRIKKFFSTIKEPKGYEREELVAKPGVDIGRLEISSPDVKVVFDVGIYKNKMSVYGHTSFKEDDSWYTFDRRGIEDSFYMEQGISDWQSPEEEIKNGGQAMLEKQIKKAKDKITSFKGMVNVPHFGHKISLKRKEEIAKKLKGGGSHTFAPSGMGTAYDVSKKKRDRWSDVVPMEVSKFFGLNCQLYSERLDWD